MLVAFEYLLDLISSSASLRLGAFFSSTLSGCGGGEATGGDACLGVGAPLLCKLFAKAASIASISALPLVDGFFASKLERLFVDKADLVVLVVSFAVNARLPLPDKAGLDGPVEVDDCAVFANSVFTDSERIISSRAFWLAEMAGEEEANVEVEEALVFGVDKEDVVPVLSAVLPCLVSISPDLSAAVVVVALGVEVESVGRVFRTTCRTAAVGAADALACAGAIAKTLSGLSSVLVVGVVGVGVVRASAAIF